MDHNGTVARPLVDFPTQMRELPQLQSLRIAPLRQPVSSRALSVPSPLEPNAGGVVDSSNNASKANSSGGSLPAKLPTLTGLLDAAQSKNNDHSVESRLSLEIPPKPILPAFINLRALERFPYSFHEDAVHVPRKRQRVDAHAESLGEHLQLPIPQSQKEHRPPPFGPFAILNGLNEPPPNAALLPPIESGSNTCLLTKPTEHGSFHQPATEHTHKRDSQRTTKRQGRIEDILDTPVECKPNGNLNESLEESARGIPQTGKTSEPPTEENDQPVPPKSRGRSRRGLRKWTEEETIALLRGVIKCGIGNWTMILAQPELKFNKRSAANLKDRFRVCCPLAYRASDSYEATRQLRDTLAMMLQRTKPDGFNTKPILPGPPQASTKAASSTGRRGVAANSNDEFRQLNRSTSGVSANSDSQAYKRSSPPPTSTPAYTLSTESKSTFASLGIQEPRVSTKSKRRSRCPFTPVEDEALLKGYTIHGFQWTLIQQDKRLNLGHRKPTHLRDRFRTRFPHAYREGGPICDRMLQKINADNDHHQSKVDTATINTLPRQAGNDRHRTCQERSLGRSRSSGDSHHDNGYINVCTTSYHQNQHTVRGPESVNPGVLQPNPQGLLEPSLSLTTPSTSAGTGSSTTATSQFRLAPPENTSSNVPSASTADVANWEDNTLPPMVWDELS